MEIFVFNSMVLQLEECEQTGSRDCDRGALERLYASNKYLTSYCVRSNVSDICNNLLTEEHCYEFTNDLSHSLEWDRKYAKTPGFKLLFRY